MRRLLPLVLVALLSGCWLFQPMDIALDPKDPVVAAILAQPDVDQAQLLKDFEALLGVELESVKTTITDGVVTGVTATAVPAYEEALVKAEAAFSKKVQENPSGPGLLEALIAAALAAGGVVAGRATKRVPSAKKPAGSSGGGALAGSGGVTAKETPDGSGT